MMFLVSYEKTFLSKPLTAANNQNFQV